MTRSGIEYDLPTSPYTVKEENTRFYFSSQLYRDKFLKLVIDKKDDPIKALIAARFNVNFECRLLALVILYMRTEKRGFYIETEGGCFRCPEELTLNGAGQIVHSFQG